MSSKGDKWDGNRSDISSHGLVQGWEIRVRKQLYNADL